MRVAILSNTRLNPRINWTTLGPPLLEPLAAHGESELIPVPPFGWEYRRDWLRAIHTYWGCDTAFWMQGSSRPAVPLWALSASKPVLRRSSLVIDPWPQTLMKTGLLALAQRLNPCFVTFREGFDELTRRFPTGKFEWMPFGVDTQVFKPGQAERDVFAYWMGRRYEPLHKALLRYCADRNLEYRYTQTQPGIPEFRDPFELGALVGRCKYFVVTPPGLDNHRQTGGYSPLVMRYLEGLAAGTRLLGVLPKSGEFQDLLPRHAICEVKEDGSDLAQRLDADMDHTEGWDAVHEAQELVRREHSWGRRAAQIYERLS